MWIQGKVYYRRPDILIFINGMPLVFIELKNSIVKVEEAYNKNLKDYMRDIPNLFAFNQICVLSNGLETKLGAFNATYDYFFEWLKVDSEKEKLDREAILAADNVKDSSVRYFVDGLLNKDSLLVVDWYKDEQPRAKLKYEVELSLNDDLPESYDKAAFDAKVSLLMNHFVDMAVQGYGWIGAA